MLNASGLARNAEANTCSELAQCFFGVEQLVADASLLAVRKNQSQRCAKKRRGYGKPRDHDCSFAMLPAHQDHQQGNTKRQDMSRGQIAESRRWLLDGMILTVLPSKSDNNDQDIGQ